MIRLAIAGATGRTGRCVVEHALDSDGFAIAAALTASDDPLRGSSLRIGTQDVPIVDKLEAACDLLIDFTLPAGTIRWLTCCLERKIPMVIGATGHDEPQRARIREAAEKIPILKAANFSIGINLLLRLVGRIAAELGSAYDIEIVEAHHRRKVDAPSGTARSLLEAIHVASAPRGGRGTAIEATGRSIEQDAVFGREGNVGPRPVGQIGVHAVRMGDLIGQHEIHFSGPGETITLRHTAHSRATFAAGALRAARWLLDKPPGLYSMRDVTG